MTLEELYLELQDIKLRLSILEDKGKRTKFTIPKPEEVTLYGKSIGFDLSGQNFCDFYESKGWKVGNTPMKSWQAAVRNWFRKSKENTQTISKPILRSIAVLCECLNCGRTGQVYVMPGKRVEDTRCPECLAIKLCPIREK